MKKILGFILTVMMLLNITPATVFAEEISLEEIFIEESFGCDFAANSLDSYTVELDLKNYYSFSLSTAKPYFCFYASDEAVYPTKYILEPDYQLFVNGIEIDTVDSSAVMKYIENNPVGKFELTDTYGSDIGYDIINVEYYATTKVTSVTADQVFFTSVDGIANITIDQQTLEEEEIELNVYMNGEKIEASEIKKNDILSIKYDPTNTKNSMFYDIYVSREYREGVFRSIDTDNKTVTIGTEDYVFVNWTSATYEFKRENLSNEYKIYLDTFGRIYTWELSASSIKYAIVDKYQQATAFSTYDNDRVRLWFTDGTYSFVEFASTARIKLPDKSYATTSDLRAYLADEANDEAEEVMNRVVTYKISSSTGKITSLEFIAGTKVENEYDERNEKIGSTIVNDATTFINVEEFIATGKIDDIETSSKDALEDGVMYSIYRYGTPSIVDNSYPLVMIVKGEANYTGKTAFAVVTKPIGSDTTEDGTFFDTLTVLYEGEEQTLFIDEEAWYDYDLVAGDVVLFKKNASDKVKEVVRIFKADDAGFYNYDRLKTNGLIADFDKYIVNPVAGNPFTMVWNPTDPNLAKLVYAPIVSRNGRNYLAQVDSSSKTYLNKEASVDNATSEGATLDIITTDDTRVYVYDYSLRAGKRFYIGSTADIIGTNVDYITYLVGDYYTIDWSWIESDEHINFAYAKIVDDIVTDIFVIKEGEQIFNTDDGIIGSITSVISVSGSKVVVNVMESLAKVYAVDYDGDALAKVQSFDAIQGKQTFTADFSPDAVYIWDSNMEALSMPWRNEQPEGNDLKVELDLALLDCDEYSDSQIESNLLDATNPYVYFYETDTSARSTKYTLEKGYKLFVNDIKIDAVDSSAVRKYVINNPVGKVELTDTSGSAEGYDVIDVEYYSIVKVTSVSSDKIYFNKVADLNLSSLPVDTQTLEGEGIELNVYMNGETIDPSEIKKNDILSIKFNPVLGENSDFFDIYISREVREGMFRAFDTEKNTVTIGSENYIFVNWASATYEFKKENLSNEYKIYLDTFGRIYTWEISQASIKYAIVDKFQEATASSTYDYDRVRLWFTDGTYSYVEFSPTAKIVTPETNDLAGVKTHIAANATNDNVMNRIVTYKISPSTGKITSLEFIAGTKIESEYDERNEKIGSTIVSDATTFINVDEFLSTGKIDDIETSSKEALVDGVQYIIYRYGTPSITDDSYPLVLIVKGEADYTEETSFAVVTKSLGAGATEDGIVLDILTVLYEGEEQTFYIDEEAWYDYDLVAGDVVVLKKNDSGMVTEIIRIFNAYAAGFVDYATLKTNGLKATNFNKYTTNPVAGDPFTMVWNPTDPNLAKLVYAPIVSFKGRNYLTQVDSSGKTYIDKEATKDSIVSEGATLEILTTDYTNVYVYDYNAARYDKFYVGSVGDIVGTPVDFATLEGEYYTVDWNSEQAKSTTVDFAFAKIVDDIVTDIFVIIGEEQ